MIYTSYTTHRICLVSSLLKFLEFPQLWGSWIQLRNYWNYFSRSSEQISQKSFAWKWNRLHGIRVNVVLWKKIIRPKERCGTSFKHVDLGVGQQGAWDFFNFASVYSWNFITERSFHSSLSLISFIIMIFCSLWLIIWNHNLYHFKQIIFFFLSSSLFRWTTFLTITVCTRIPEGIVSHF